MDGKRKVRDAGAVAVVAGAIAWGWRMLSTMSTADFISHDAVKAIGRFIAGLVEAWYFSPAVLVLGFGLIFLSSRMRDGDAEDEDWRYESLQPRSSDTPTRADFRRRVAAMVRDVKGYYEERDRSQPIRDPDNEMASLDRLVAYRKESEAMARQRFAPRIQALYDELCNAGIEDGELHKAVAEHHWKLVTLIMPELIGRFP
jgi:hypothetical protein